MTATPDRTVDEVASVVIAEDSLLVREGIRALLETSGHIVAAVVEDFEALMDAVEATRPDVVITDIRMPPNFSDEGIRAARLIRASYPEIGVIVLSQFIEPEYPLRVFEGGSAGLAYLLKERVSDIDQMEVAIAAVRRGDSSIDPKVVEALVEGGRKRRESKLGRLSERETQVLEQIAAGKSNAAIAKSVFLSERGVERNINSIFSKLDLPPEHDSNRRVQAVLLYLSEQER